LSRNRQGFIKRHGAARQPLGEILAVHELERQGNDVVGLFETVDGGNIRMIERGEDLRFTSESRKAIRIVRNGWQQDFDRDAATQLRVGGAIHLAHSACADSAGDFEVTDAGSGGQSQFVDGLYRPHRTGDLADDRNWMLARHPAAVDLERWPRRTRLTHVEDVHA